MASIHARQRDPLLDQNTQALLERRGRELLGIAMLFIAFAFALPPLARARNTFVPGVGGPLGACTGVALTKKKRPDPVAGSGRCRMWCSPRTGCRIPEPRWIQVGEVSSTSGSSDAR